MHKFAMVLSRKSKYGLEIELLDRELITPYLGNSEKVVGQRMAQVNFDVELAGSGTAGTAPKWGKILMACGFAQGGTGGVDVIYTPVSGTFSSVTLDFKKYQAEVKGKQVELSAKEYDVMRYLIEHCKNANGACYV